jgi:hypothetical protein
MTSRLALPLLAAALLATAPSARAQSPEAAAGRIDPASLSGALSTHRLIDTDVHGAEDREIGEIEDIVLPQGGGAPAAILSVGGFLGVGERHVAVPLSALQHDVERGRWSLPGATAESLRALPPVSLAEFRRGRSNRGGVTPGTGTTTPEALTGGPRGSGAQQNR